MALASTETSILALHRSLTAAQRAEICFAWDHVDPTRGLLRAFIANHWQVTRPCIRSDFYSRGQQQAIHEIFRGLIAPEWYPRFLKQLGDDNHGHPWGTNQSIALFGDPEAGPFQFVLCGRHLTLRADGRTEGRLAFGGPILYGHAASGYFERPHHPGNVFWEQALWATRLFDVLEPEQQRQAIVAKLPPETAIGFGGAAAGLSAAALSAEQKAQLLATLGHLVDPFRVEDRRRVGDCLQRQGGLEACRLKFSRDGRMSAPAWDNWRIEGPSFVWHYRGFPHVHAWVHVADEPGVPVNAHRGTYLYAHHDPLR